MTATNEQLLEGQRKEASAIVYRWFRFRTRRALGILYCVYSALPVFGSLLYALTGSLDVSIAGGTVAGVASSVVLRAAGFWGFGRMGSVIELMQGGRSTSTWNRYFVGSVLIALWPWIGFAVAAAYNIGALEALFAAIWLVELLGIRILVIRRSRGAVLEARTEDWIVLISFPVAALLSSLPGLPVLVHSYAFLSVTPVLLSCGIKSLYDAPRELVVELGSESG